MNICVFGAARDEIDEAFFGLGDRLGRQMGDRGHTLVFGGGAHGLMGAVARGVKAAGGRVVGVAPRFFDVPGILFADCDEMVNMDTMAERKTIMRDRSDAFIALPGGIGTMEEVFEVITLRSLGRTDKPVAFLDALDYWAPAEKLIRSAVEKGFAGEDLLQVYGRFTDPGECLDYLERTR